MLGTVLCQIDDHCEVMQSAGNLLSDSIRRKREIYLCVIVERARIKTTSTQTNIPNDMLTVWT